MATLTTWPTGAPAPVAVARDGGRLVVQTWLFSRLLLVGVALWVSVTTGRSASDMLANWDVQHYFAIAQHGYTGGNDIAFFPGWPLVLRAFATLGVPMLWAGVGLALVCSALAASALHRLGGPIAAVVWLLAPTTVFTLVPYTEAPFCAAAFWAWERARRGRWGAAASLAAIACSLRVSGLFLLGALAILALTSRGGRPARPDLRPPAGASATPGQRWTWPYRDDWPQQAAGRGADLRQWLALRWASLRGSAQGPVWPGRAQSGEVGAHRRRWSPPPGSGRALAWLALPAAVLAGYAGYLFWLTGDWFAWYHAQSAGWPRGFTWPWVALQHTIEAATSTAYPAFPEWSWVFRAEIVSMAIGLLGTVVCLLKRRWAEASWVGVQVLAFSCSYWFLSVNRALLLWFPLYILIGEALSGGWNVSPGRRRLRVLLTVLGFVVAGAALCFWAWLFFTGRWAS